jgi:hypothetical protein
VHVFFNNFHTVAADGARRADSVGRQSKWSEVVDE